MVSNLAISQTWNGNVSDEWHVGGNWSSGSAPGPTSAVTIPSTLAAGKPWPRLTNDDVTVGSLALNNGSQMNVNGRKITVANAVIINGATVSNSGAGAITIEAGAGNSYLRNSTFTAALDFKTNGASALYEAYDVGANTYDGDVKFTISATGIHNISTNFRSQFKGDLIIERTAAGETNVLTSNEATSVAVKGDFSYKNHTGGNTTIGGTANKATLEGKVDIDVETIGSNPSFTLRRLDNSGGTGGGTISVVNPGTVAVNNDTLILASFIMTGKSGSSSTLGNNTISGAFTYSDASGNGGYLTSYGNVFDGTSGFTLNSPAAFYESYSSAPDGNIYKGDAVFTANGGGLLHIGYTHSATFEAGLSVTRTVAGVTNILTSGGSVGGNFSYTNEAGGATTIGVNSGVPVAGTVNILTDALEGNPAFNLYGLSNATTGGTIEIKKPGGFNVIGNSLMVSEMKMLDKNGSSSDFGNNTISGAFIYSDASGNGGYLTSYGNVFDGTSGFTFNSPAAFYDSYSSSSNGNVYKDNAIFTRLGAGALHIAYSRASEFHKNLTIHSSAGLTFSQELRFAGNSDGTLQQTGSQPLQLAALTLDKSNNTKLVLGSPTDVSGAVSFLNGYLQTDAVNYFNFAGNSAGHSGAGDQSHIVGPVRKAGTNAFTFPVGNGSAYHPVSISAPGGASHVFSAEYKPSDPVNYDPESFESPLEKVSDHGYWDVQRLTGSSGVRLTLTYKVPPGFITEPNDLRVAHWSGTGWESIGSSADETSTNTEGRVITDSPVTSFSPFALGTTNFAANPLPVRLAEFSATKENQAVVLQWTTTEEHGFDRFEVEQSNDGKSWREIGRVSAKGTALSPARYAYVDNRPFPGDSYYRLRMADLDGSFALSDIRMVSMTGSAAGSLSIYPNPATDHILISPSSTFFTVSSLELFDISGRKVAGITESLNGRLDVRALPSGLYLVKVTYSNQAVESRRLVISR